LPGASTIWPASKKFRCSFQSKLFYELAVLAENHAEPEILDHLYIYQDTKPLLEWHDAFSNAMLLSPILSEESVFNFAKTLGLTHAKASFSV
jgi:hypothetical protein